MRPENPAAFPILDLQRKRWSPRAFDPNRSIDPDAMRSLLEAARWSPSSFNGQPWSFLLAMKEDAEQFQTILSCLFERNQLWARHASALMIVVAFNIFEASGKPNHHGKYDSGGAVANLTFEATAKGIYIHQMAGFDAEKSRATYGVPATADPIAAIAMGYLGDPNSLPADFRDIEEKPKPRKTIGEFTFAGKWGVSAPVIDVK